MIEVRLPSSIEGTGSSFQSQASSSGGNSMGYGREIRGVKMINILLVDGYELLRKMLKKQIDLEPDLMVIGEAGNGPATLEKAQSLRPDVILMDLDIPGMDGLETTRALKGIVPQIPVILLSMSQNVTLHRTALSVGATDLIAKEVDPIVLFNAIRRAALTHQD
jgi:DNA-binding NarL/FixJ family response regulator